MSFECTRKACLARSIDEVESVCAASPACKACRFRTCLWANGEYTDDAEVLRPTPPGPPFTRGGKLSATAGICATKTLLWPSTLQLRQPQLCAAPASPSHARIRRASREREPPGEPAANGGPDEAPRNYARPFSEPEPFFFRR